MFGKKGDGGEWLERREDNEPFEWRGPFIHPRSLSSLIGPLIDELSPILTDLRDDGWWPGGFDSASSRGYRFDTRLARVSPKKAKKWRGITKDPRITLSNSTQLRKYFDIFREFSRHLVRAQCLLDLLLLLLFFSSTRSALEKLIN